MSSFSLDPENAKQPFGGSQDQRGAVVCSLPHPSNFKFEPQVGVNTDTTFSSPPKNVASTDKGVVGMELVPSREDFVGSVSVFWFGSLCLSYFWFLARYCLSQNPVGSIPVASAILFIILWALLLCIAIIVGCFLVYCIVISLMRRLPEDVALKIKANFDLNNIAVSAASSCCFLFLSAIFSWLLDMFVKILIVKDEHLYPRLYLSTPYSMACLIFLSMATMCMGITRRPIIIIIERFMRSCRQEEAESLKQLPSHQLV